MEAEAVTLPTPYYSRDGIVIYHADCRDILPHLDPVDLVLTDPPYFRVKGEAWDRQWRDAPAFLAWLGGVADLWASALTPNGSLYCFASPEMSARVEVMLRERFHVLNHIRWVKRQGWHKKADKDALRRYLSPWEGVIFAEPFYSDGTALGESGYADATRELHKRVYSPIGDYIRQERERAGWTRNQVEVALGYVSTADTTRGTALCCRWEEGSSLPTAEAYGRLQALLNNGTPGEYLRKDYEDLRRPFNVAHGDEATDVWEFDVVMPEALKHPCQKPTAMLEYAILKSTKLGGVVLDTFAGTGSALWAARSCGRKAIGIEIEERYCEIAAKRLAQQVFDFDGGSSC